MGGDVRKAEALLTVALVTHSSCMFTALSIVLEHGKPGMPQKLREGGSSIL